MGTAVNEMTPVEFGYGNYIWLPVCRCWVAEPNTGSGIYCPLHGWVEKDC